MKNAQNKKSFEELSSVNWFIVWGCALVTLSINTSFYDPFNTPKLIVLFLISAWLTGHLLKSFISYKSDLKQKITPAFILVLLFLVSLLISALLTDVNLTAFIGETQRRNGFLAYFSLSIILLSAYQFINFKYSLRIFKVSILTGFILSLYGLIQVSGNDFLEWNNPYNSMISTLGNPNFASAMLAIISSICSFSLFLKNINRRYKYTACIVILTSLFAILKSESRQGLVTYTFAIIFFITIYSLRIKIRFYWTIVLTSLLVGTISILGMLQIGPLSGYLYKESVSIRGYYWRAGLEMLINKPLTGVGVDRYGAYFKEFREVGYPLKYGFDITSTNAHNVIIQLFSTSGVFVGIFYIILLLYTFYKGLYLVQKTTGENLTITLALLSAWIGFQAQSFISIDNIGLSVWGWLLTGTILGLERDEELRNKIIQSRTFSENHTNKIKVNVFQPLVSFFCIIVVSYFSYFLIQSETATLKSRALTNVTAPQNAPFLYNEAFKVLDNPYADPYYKFIVSTFLYDMGFQDQAKKTLNKLLISDQRNLDYLRAIAYYQKIDGNVNDEIKTRNEISKYDKYNAANYLELFKLFQSQGAISNASEIKSKILSFAPSSIQAKEVIRLSENYG